MTQSHSRGHASSSGSLLLKASNSRLLPTCGLHPVTRPVLHVTLYPFHSQQEKGAEIDKTTDIPTFPILTFNLIFLNMAKGTCRSVLRTGMGSAQRWAPLLVNLCVCEGACTLVSSSHSLRPHIPFRVFVAKTRRFHLLLLFYGRYFKSSWPSTYSFVGNSFLGVSHFELWALLFYLPAGWVRVFAKRESNQVPTRGVNLFRSELGN